MFYFILALILLFAIIKNIFWLIVAVSLVLSISLINRLFSCIFVVIILIIDWFAEMIRRKKKDSGIKNEKIYDKTDPYWELEKALDEFNKSFGQSNKG